MRIAHSLSCLTALLLAGRPLVAQTGSTAAPTVPSGSTALLFAPLPLPPAPSATRLATGAPGPKYWQNRAAYDLQGTLDTTTNTLRGSMILRYTNNSPDTLPILWLQTENRTEVIDRFDQVLGTTSAPLANGHPTGDVFELQVTLTKPLPPGQTATFHVEWHFTVKKGQRDGTLYQIAQWYPRLNVYDDVKGWNTESYATGAEYFLEYGDYTMAVTLPAGYIVAATGTLDNPHDVLTPAEIARLALAATADTVVRVVTAAELTNGTARPTTTGMLTWKFHAQNVRDAVWCAAPNYQWDVTHWQQHVAQAYYRPSAQATWTEAADMARMSIQEYSERWLPYPYPQISAVEGPEEGMEYPMLSMVSQGADKPQLYDVITHEVGHNWFPMIVGSNERVHTWMDEGFNQFINTFSNARRYPQSGDQVARGQRYVRWVGQAMASGQDTPLETGQVIGNTGAQYFKTAGVLEMLRSDVMGPALFDQGLRTYVQRWAYKHPTPMDFFRTMSDVAGKNLDWFWREWFLEAPKFDQSIDSVAVTQQGQDTHVKVVYENKQTGVMPLLVRVTFADSTTQDFTYPVEIWQGGAMYTASYAFAGKQVRQVTIDPERHFIDMDRRNNQWTAK